MSNRPVALGCALLLCTGPASADARSPYAGQPVREIKALSAGQIADYLAGNGMGLARAAELNGYPGPAHVLELAGALELNAAQRASTQALFDTMQARAMRLGKALVHAERALDRDFAERTIDPDRLAQATAHIASLHARLRQVHLEAHLEQRQLLSAQQVAKYAELRGYANDSVQHGHAGHGQRPR